LRRYRHRRRRRRHLLLPLHLAAVPAEPGDEAREAVVGLPLLR